VLTCRAAAEGRVRTAGEYKDADHLDVDGLPHVGALIWPGETTYCTKDAVTGRYRGKKLKVGLCSGGRDTGLHNNVHRSSVK
jgi:hypothetical protein